MAQQPRQRLRGDAQLRGNGALALLQLNRHTALGQRLGVLQLPLGETGLGILGQAVDRQLGLLPVRTRNIVQHRE